MKKRGVLGTAASMTRRDALRLGGGAGLGLVAALGVPVSLVDAEAQAPSPAAGRRPSIPSWKTELRQLAPGVYAYVQAGGPEMYRTFIPESLNQFDNGSVSNAGVVVGERDLLAIDALAAPLHAKAFIAAATNATGKTFGRLVNTHHHGDHTNGNQFFLPAEIVSHEFCREEVLRAIASREPGATFGKREFWADGTEVRVAAPPVTTFPNKISYLYGSTVVELLFLGIGHTWGDIVAYLPQHRILFAGDLTFNLVTPSVHNGHTTKWIEVLDTIMAMDVDTIVPGHGPIHGKKEVAVLRDYFVILKREARKRFDVGMSIGRAAADIDMGMYEVWTNPERNVRNVLRLYDEFNDTIVPAFDSARNNVALEEYRTLRAPSSGRTR